MRALTGDNRFTEHVDEFEKEKEAVTMCEVLDKVERRGEKRGEERGEKRGKQNAASLMNYLWRNGRGEEAERAANDRDFFDKLLTELTPVLTLAK